MRLACALAIVASAPAWACPTCVGQRLGDEGSEVGEVLLLSSTSFGADWLGHDPARAERRELREDIGGKVTLAAGRSLELGVPLIARWVDGPDATSRTFGPSALRVLLHAELWRREEPASSDTLGVVAGAQSALMGLVSGVPSIGQPSSNAVTPQLAFQFQHADQGWGSGLVLAGAVPIPYDELLRLGPSLQLSGFAGKELLRWLRLTGVAEIKGQWSTRSRGVDVPATAFVAGFVGGELTAQPSRSVSIGLSVFAPLFCISDGYAHSPTARLTISTRL